MDQFFGGTRTLRNLQAGPFVEHRALFDEIIREMVSLGHPESTIKDQIRVAVAFGEWLRTRTTPLSAVSNVTLEEFLATRREKYCQHGTAGATRKLVRRLQSVGACAAATVEGTAEPAWAQDVQAYVEFLQRERGLQTATIAGYRRFVTAFLSERFDGIAYRLLDLAAKDVTSFVRRHANDGGPKHSAAIGASLRSFLGFLFLRGLVATNLSGAVPTVAMWRLQELPKALPANEVELLLRSCDRSTSTGCRDYAMLLIMARLGLRAGEVLKMSLDDIDWASGDILICGKGRRLHRLPLPQEVGQAIADYLRRGRPVQAKTRAIFIRAYAPYRELAGASTICCIMRRALRRAGLAPPRLGTHTLRHGLACRMLNNGASLAEIGQLLRHQRVDTTTIYAKVDLEALRPLALPWPGGVR